MADSQSKPTAPKPSIGRIVIVRNHEGVDMPAIITEVADAETEAVHLAAFPPPGEAAPHANHQYGFARAEDDADPDDPAQAWRLLNCWRWPGRV